jgi:hypothetical protein
MVSETKDEATDPFQPIDPEQPIKEADTKASPTVQHISKKITIRKIDKKAPSQKPALIKEPEKNVKKKADPIKMPKTDPESKIVSNDQTQITTVKNPAPIPDSKTEPKKITPAKNLADTEKTATASKTTQLKPEKAVQENAGPDAIKLDTTKSSTK